MKKINLKLQSFLHGLFEFGVLIKAFNGLWETASGILVLILSKTTLSNLLNSFARGELSEDPRDFFINFIVRIFRNVPPHAKTFVALYILGHGLLNIFLAIQLYRNRLWAYPVTIGVMIIFLFYQIYRITLYHSQFLIYLTIFDFFFILLAWNEYRHQITKREEK